MCPTVLQESNLRIARKESFRCFFLAAVQEFGGPVCSPIILLHYLVIPKLLLLIAPIVGGSSIMTLSHSFHSCLPCLFCYLLSSQSRLLPLDLMLSAPKALGPLIIRQARAFMARGSNTSSSGKTRLSCFNTGVKHTNACRKVFLCYRKGMPATLLRGPKLQASSLTSLSCLSEKVYLH